MSDAAPAVVVDVATETTPTDAGGTPEPTSTPPVATDPPPAPVKRTMKAKVYGEERELSADAVEGLAKELGIPPEFVLRNLQTSAAAQKRLQEVAEKEKTWAERQAKLKADPWAAFEGQDPDAAAIARVQAIMEREAMNPDQRARAEAEQKIAEYQAREKAQQEEQQTAAQQAETQKVIGKLNVELPAAAEAAGLPRSPAVGRMMIDFMLTQARAGVEVDPADAAQYAKETTQQWTAEVIKGMDGDQLDKFLGPEVIKKVLANAVARVRGKTAQPTIPPQGAPQAKKEPSFLTPEEFRRRYG